MFRSDPEFAGDLNRTGGIRFVRKIFTMSDHGVKTDLREKSSDDFNRKGMGFVRKHGQGDGALLKLGQPFMHARIDTGSLWPRGGVVGRKIRQNTAHKVNSGDGGEGSLDKFHGAIANKAPDIRMALTGQAVLNKGAVQGGRNSGKRVDQRPIEIENERAHA